MKLKLAPGKIAVKRIEAKLKGGIALPPSRIKAYEIGEVTCVGPLDKFGHESRDKTVESYKPGDLVLFQLPVTMAAMTSHMVKNVANVFLNVMDIIARLDSTVIELKQFHIAGRYILVKPSVRKSDNLIVIPETAQEALKESLHFSVMQLGADVTIDVKVGQEIFPHKARVNPMMVDNEEVAFVEQSFIDGVMAED